MEKSPIWYSYTFIHELEQRCFRLYLTRHKGNKNKQNSTLIKGSIQILFSRRLLNQPFELLRDFYSKAWCLSMCFLHIPIKHISDYSSRINPEQIFFLHIPEHFGLYPSAGSIRNRIIRPSCNGDEVRKHALYEKSSSSSSESRGLPRFHLGFLSGIFSEIMQIQRVSNRVLCSWRVPQLELIIIGSHCYENVAQVLKSEI